MRQLLRRPDGYVPLPMHVPFAYDGTPSLLIEFARVETDARSPWYGAGQPAPDYGTPAMAASLASGTSVQIEYRGVAALGTTPTAWSQSPNIADGMRYLQFRMTFLADLISGEVPVVDTLVVPIN